MLPSGTSTELAICAKAASEESTDGVSTSAATNGLVSTGTLGAAGADGAAGVYSGLNDGGSSAEIGSNASVCVPAEGCDDSDITGFGILTVGWNTGGTTGAGTGSSVCTAGALTGDTAGDVKISRSALFNASKDSVLSVDLTDSTDALADMAVASVVANSGAIICVSPALAFAEKPVLTALDGSPTKSATRAYDSRRVFSCTQELR